MEKAPKQGHPSQNNKYEDQDSRANSFRDETLLEDRLLSKSPLMGTGILGDNIIAPSRANAIVQTEPKQTEETTVTDESDLQGELMEMSASKTNDTPPDEPLNVKEAARLIANIWSGKEDKKIKAIKAYTILKKLPDAKDIEEFTKTYSGLWDKTISNLPGEFLRSDAFGLFNGVSDGEKEKLLELLKNDATWKDLNLLGLVLQLIVQAYADIDSRDKSKEAKWIIITDPKVEEAINQKKDISTEQAAVLSAHHFTNGKYEPQPIQPDQIRTPRLKKSRVTNILETLFNLIMARPIEVSMEGFTRYLGPTGGTEFGTANSIDGDSKLIIDKNRKEKSITVTADLLPIAAINYQGTTFTFRAGESALQKLDAKIKFPQRTERDQPGNIEIDIKKLIFNDLSIISNESTMVIGKLEIGNLHLNIEQTLGVKPLVNMKALEIMFLVMNQISLLSSGLMMAMTNMVEAKNQGEMSTRKKDQDLLKETMQNEFLHNLDMELTFLDLTMENFIYVDKDKVQDDLTGETSSKSDVSFIKKLSVDPEGAISAGSITLKAQGVDSEKSDALYENKMLLKKQEKKSGKLGEKLEENTLEGDQKRIDKFKQRLKTQKSNIENTRKNIDTDQAKLEFELKAELKGVKTEGAEFLDELMGGMIESNVKETKGFNNVDAAGVNFSTTFNNQHVKSTSMKLDNFHVPKLMLNDINYTDSKSLCIHAENITINDTMASLNVIFKDSDVEESVMGEKVFKIKQDLATLRTLRDTLAFQLLEMELKDPDHYEYDPLQIEKQRLDELIEASEYQAMEYEKYQNLNSPVEEIQISNLTASTVELKNAEIELIEQRLTAYLGVIKPLTLSGLKMSDMLIDTRNLAEIKLTPADKKDKVQFSLDQLVINEGDNIAQKDEMGRNILASTFHDITAGSINVDLLRSGEVNYDMKTLKGGANVDLISYNDKGVASTRTSIFKLPELVPLQDENGTNLSALSGNYNKGAITASARIPELDVPLLNFGDKKFSMQTKGNKVSTLKNIQVDYEYDPKTRIQKEGKEDIFIPTMNIKRLYINNLDAYGLNIHLMTPADPENLVEKTEKHIRFPENAKTSVIGIELRNYRMENSPNADNKNKLEWHYQPGAEVAKLTTGKTVLPGGVRYNDIIENSSMILQNGGWDSSTFNLLEHGGLGYSFTNLDALFLLEDKDEDNNVTMTSELGLDSKSVGGKYTTEEKNDNGVMRKYIYLEGNVDISALNINQLTMKTDGFSLEVPKTANQSLLSDINGKYKVTMKMPTVEEKRAVIKKAKLAEETAKKSEGKIKRDLLELAKEKAKPEVNIHIDHLNMSEAKLYEAKVTSTSESKIDVQERKGKSEEYYTTTTTQVKLRPGEAAILRQLKMTDSEITLPKGDKKPFNFSGNFSIGTEEEKGFESGIFEFYSGATQKLLKGDAFLGSDRITATPVFSAQSITFGGDLSKAYKLTVVKPEFDLPENLPSYSTRTQKRKMFDGSIAELPLWENSVTGLDISSSHDDMNYGIHIDKKDEFGMPLYLKSLFTAASIEVESYKTTNSQGVEEYKKRFILTDPILNHLSAGGNFDLKSENESLDIYLEDLILSGKVTGKLIIEQSEANLDKKDKNHLSPVWEIKTEESEINIGSGHASLDMDDLNKYIKDKNKGKPKEKNESGEELTVVDKYRKNEYAFLDAASGNVKVTMFGHSHTNYMHQFTVKQKGKPIEIGGYVNVKNLIENIAAEFEPQFLGGYADAILGDLSCAEFNGAYYISTREAGEQYVMKILNTTSNNNLLKVDGQQYVRLSAMVNTIANTFADPPPEFSATEAGVEVLTGYGKKGLTESTKEGVDRLLYRTKNRMNPVFDIDAKIDLQKIPENKRGMLKMFKNGKLDLSLTTGFKENVDLPANEDDRSYNYDKDIYPTATINHLSIPAFETKFGSQEKSPDMANGIISSTGIEIGKTTFQYQKHVSPVSSKVTGGDNGSLYFSDIKLSGFNLKLFDKKKK